MIKLKPLIEWFFFLQYNQEDKMKPDEIKEIRKKVGLSQKNFSEQYGIPVRTIEEWESGRRTPPEYVVRMLAYYVAEHQLYKNEILAEKEISYQKQRNVNVVKDINGEKIVVIHDIIFKNRQNIHWNDVEKYLEQYVGEFYTIAEDGEEIYIGKDLPDEYSNSKYTAHLKGSAAKAKANAAQALPELIEISRNGIYSQNYHEKHRKDAQYGWFRYDSRFAIAVYNNMDEIDRYNVYHVRMIIRHDMNGKKYLYDIINIKKEPSTPLG